MFRGLGYGERKGIQEGHAYSVMRAVEMDGQRLLLLKNPWGKVEWTGAWSMFPFSLRFSFLFLFLF